MQNERAVIGSNSLSLDQAKARLETSGYMLARLETLAMAVRDDRIDRGCLKVLVELIDSMNRETWTSWIGRDEIGNRAGMTAKSAGNYIYQLKALGYIVGERRETPQASNRTMMHYTLSKLSPEEIESAIDRAIGSIRGERNSIVEMKSARHDGQSTEKVPAGTGKKVPARTGNTRQDGQSEAKSARQDGQSVPAGTGTEAADVVKTTASARQDGCSKNNSSLTKNLPSGEREASSPKGTRLNPSWSVRDTPDWGRWVTDHFNMRPSEVEREAEKFRDYWIAQPAARGVKLDWFATWRNWIRRAYAGREKCAVTDVTKDQDAATKKLAAIYAKIREEEGYEVHGGDQ